MMLKWLRKYLRRPEPQPYTDGLFELAIKRSQEELPCCGKMRRVHSQYRSGALKCPEIWRTPEGYLKRVKQRLDLRYDPLVVDEEWCPPWGELHFKCNRCGCMRGVHAFREDGKRGDCTDPDCPGCLGGCR